MTDPTWRASVVWRPTWHTWGLGRAWTCPEGWCQSMWCFKHNGQPAFWWLMSLCLSADSNASYLTWKLWGLSWCFQAPSLVPHLRSRPPSLGCRPGPWIVELYISWSWYALQTCRHSLIRWPNFRSMFQRWSCCQEFPENFMKTTRNGWQLTIPGG